MALWKTCRKQNRTRRRNTDSSFNDTELQCRCTERTTWLNREDNKCCGPRPFVCKWYFCREETSSWEKKLTPSPAAADGGNNEADFWRPQGNLFNDVLMIEIYAFLLFFHSGCGRGNLIWKNSMYHIFTRRTHWWILENFLFQFHWIY